MELIQTGAEQVYNVTAEQDGWKVNASVSVDEGKVVNLNGSAVKDNKSVAFNGYRTEEAFVRTVYNVTDETNGIYAVLEALVDAVRVKYEL